MNNIELLQLDENIVDLWVVKPDELQDLSLLAAYDQLMSEQERQKQQRYRFAQDRHDALITRAFARTVLSHYAPDIAPQDWQFVKGDKGKPEIANSPLPLRFNISHTTGFIVCAVALNVDLGVDVEYLKRKSSTIKIADYKFSATEVAELKSLPVAHQSKRFFDYWTLKESYIKAVGGGLSIPLDEFSFIITDDNTIDIVFDEKRNDDASQWQSWLMHGSEDHRIAISIKDPKQQPHTLRFFESIPLQKSWPITLPLP